jgi:hypothetical protein
MGGIYLRKIGPGLFSRDGRFPLAGFWRDVYQSDLFENVPNYHILTDPTAGSRVPFSVFRNCAIHVPVNNGFELVDTAPESLWDITDRLFLRPKPYSWCRYPMAIAMSFIVKLAGLKVCFVVICDYRQNNPICRMIGRERYIQEAETIFGKHRENSVLLSDLEMQNPGIFLLRDYADFAVRNEIFRISVSLKKGVVESISKEVELLSMVFKVGQVDKQLKSDTPPVY